MKCLSLDSEGHLVIPTADGISKACPVALDEEQLKVFAAWREEFIRPKAAAPEPGNAPGPEPGTAPVPSVNTPGKTPEPGTQVTDEAKLKEDFKDEVVSEKPLPEGGSGATRATTLALTENKAAVGAQKCLRVWLRNKSAKDVTLPVGTLFGQGGQGSFVSLVSTPLEAYKR